MININYTQIGQIIKRKRIELKFTRKDLINKINSNRDINILSEKTLQRIENGYESSIDNIYKIISNELNIYFDNDISSYNELNTLKDKAFALLNNFPEINEIENCLNEFSIFLKRNQNKIYLEDYSKLYIEALNYYLTNEISNVSIITFFKEIKNILNHNDKVIENYLLFATYVKKYNLINKEEAIEIGNILNRYNVFSFDEIYYYIISNQYIDMAIKYNSILKKPTNIIKYFNALNSMSWLDMELNNNTMALKYLKEAYDCDSNLLYIPKYALNLVKLRIAVVSYKLKDFATCFSTLDSLISEDNFDIGMKYVIYFKSAIITGNQEIAVTNSAKQIATITNPQTKKVIDYFIGKINNLYSYSELETIIITNFTKKFIKSPVLFNTFKDELSEIVDKTKHYKLYKMYDN